MSHGTKKAVATAVAVNAVVTLVKFLTAFAGGSPSMMNTALHSLMSTLTQGFLFFGVIKATQSAGKNVAFSHAQKKHLWNLWGAVGLFSTGAGLGLAYAWCNINAADGPALVHVFGIFFDPLGLALLVLCLAFIIEGYSFIIVLNAFLSAMRRDGYSSPFSYFAEYRRSVLVVVVVEGFVAMLGLIFAITGIGLSAVTGTLIWDVGFSALIAVTLGGFALYLGMLK